jgi:hypothetical protein
MENLLEQKRVTKKSRLLKKLEAKRPYSEIRELMGRNWKRPWIT